MLNAIFLIAGVLAAVLPCGVFAVLPWRWAVLLVPAGYLAAAVLYLAAIAVAALFLPSREDPSCRPFLHRLIAATLRWFLPFLFRMRIEGADRLPDTPFLLVGNHLSAFDPLITIALLRGRTISFVSKPENFRIPVAGRFIRAAGFLSINRESAREAVTAIRRTAENIAQDGICMGIYPEGTRSREGHMLPFHDGSFKVAKMAGCPVAAVSIRYDRPPFGRRRAVLRVVDVMDADYIAENRTNRISERAYAAICADTEN